MVDSIKNYKFHKVAKKLY